MKKALKDLAIGSLIGAILFWVPAFIFNAKADPLQCVPTYNTICTGPILSCNVGFDNCSSIPGEPGTWNPRGYTPKVG